LNVTGSLTSFVNIASGATLTGTGTVGVLNVHGTLAPGASPGILRTGQLTFGSTGVFAVEIGGVTAGQYDQVQVTGTVALSGALNVTLFGGFTPSANGSYVLIDNDGADAVSGTFTGLAQGATVTVGAVKFAISYVGGDGNDVVLTYTAPPAPQPPEPAPNTPTPGADVLSLPAAGGQMLALVGDDTVTGGAGADYIHGNQGDDQIVAGGGADTVLGGQGSDFIQGNQGSDLLFGDLGDDSLMGGQGDDYIHGNQGRDVLLGDLGNDTLLGGQGEDVIAGGEGNDYLSGDLGDDVLTGGGGADVFNFVLGQGRDVVTDFGQGDHIQLSVGQAANFQALAAKMSMAGADTVISLGAETIVLAGVQMASNLGLPVRLGGRLARARRRNARGGPLTVSDIPVILDLDARPAGAAKQGENSRA
jgi:Ca2+-binding RTX toxin-like protein